MNLKRAVAIAILSMLGGLASGEELSPITPTPTPVIVMCIFGGISGPVTLTPPPITQNYYFTSSKQTYYVRQSDDVQATIYGAEDGSRIVIADRSDNFTADINNKHLVIEMAPDVAPYERLFGTRGFLSGACGCYTEAPPLFNVVDSQVIFKGLEMWGGMGGGPEQDEPMPGESGGDGGPAVRATSSTVVFIDCKTLGGQGGRGGGGYSPPPGDGGDGGPALELINSIAYADGASSFFSGGGGWAGMNENFDCGEYGDTGVPVAGAVNWGRVTLMVDPGAERRAVGDVDASDYTDTADFLTLLDHWQSPAFSPPLGIGDFLGLLDGWQTGAVRSVVIEPAILDLGSQDIRDGAGPENFLTLTNDGPNPVTVHHEPFLPFTEFAITPGGTLDDQGYPAIIPPGQSRTLSLIFDPYAVGTRSYGMRIVTDANQGSPEFQVTLTGIGTSRVLGTVFTKFQYVPSDGPGGALEARTYNVTATSYEAVTLTAAPSFQANLGGHYALTGGTLMSGPYPRVIQPGESETLEVTFDPLMANFSLTCYIKFPCNAPIPGTTQIATIVGNSRDG